MTPWGSIMKRISDLENMSNYARRGGIETGWYCMKPNCLYSEKGIMNYHTRKFCNGCFTHRDVAERPPPPARQPRQRQVQGSQGADMVISSSEQSDKEAKKREKRTNKRKEKNTARQAWKDAAAERHAPANASSTVAAIPEGNQPPGPVATAMAAADLSANTAAKPSKSRTAGLRLPDEWYVNNPLLSKDMLKEILDSFAMESVPAPVEARSPDAILLKALGDRGPAAKVAKVTELQATIAVYKSMLTTAQTNSDATSDVEPILQEKLESAEAALVKAMRDQPSQMSELKAVQEARSKYELTVQTTKDQQQKGLAKALERKKQRHVYISKLKVQLDALDTEVTKLEDANNAAHAARVSALTDIDTKVFVLFDAKVAALQQQGPTGTPQSSTTPPPMQHLALPAPAQPDPTALSPLTELEKARKEILELQAKMAHHANIVVQQFEKHFEEITPEKLPSTRIPEEQHLAATGAVFEVLQKWNVAGAVLPFDWDALDLAVGPHLDAIVVARELVGQELWQKWYADTAPQGATVVPRQLALLVHHCLGNIQQVFIAAKEAIGPLAAKGNDAVRESAKRLRTQ